MSDIKTIGVLGYPACSEQATITPLEILKGAALVLSQKLTPLPAGGKPQDLTVQLVSMDEGNIKMQMGTQVVQDAVVGDQTFDMLYIPGGVGSGQMTQNQRFLDPRVGTRKGELMEMPIMLVVTIVAARWIVLHFAILSEALVRLGESAASRSPSCWSRNSASCSGCAACR